jgi:pSer/pThr/pTyr-binding forkhead associated (FHA) protein
LVLKQLPATVGRSSKADVRLTDRWVSRIHCEISEINGTLVVRDLESSNGTSVNGQYVEEALLLPGDRLTLGISSFHVRYQRRKPTGSRDAESDAERVQSTALKAVPRCHQPTTGSEHEISKHGG